MIMKLLILILTLTLFFMPIGLCEIIKDDINLNYIKIYDNKNKTISIYDKNIDKSMDIKLISTLSDIDKLIKIVEITNYIEYIPKEKQDFITKTRKVYGKNNIYKIEYFIEKYNYTFDYIIINETIFNNKTGKNETKLINKSIIKDIKPFWVEFKPYNKIMFKNETFKLKIIHYKKPELGFFKIQTIPIFKNIECKEFTWWNGNWNLKRPIFINNIIGDNITNYQLKSVNLSQYQINASSTRIINETSGLIQSHWNETIDFNGNLEFVWCNFSKILNNTWINETYYIYYQSNPNVNSISDIHKTMIFGDDFNDGIINLSIWNIDKSPTELNGNIILNSALENITANKYELAFKINQTVRVYVNINSIIINNFRFKVSDTIYSTQIGINDDGFGILLHNTVTYTQTGNDGSRTEIERGISPTEWIICEMTWKNNIIEFIINENIYIHNTNIPTLTDTDMYLMLTNYFNDETTLITYVFVKDYINNQPELWTVGNIEYPEGLNMTCNLEIITHLTEKEIKIINMTGDIVNISKTNECINLSYDSYIVYMSNPVKIDSMTNLLNILDNILVQFLLFIFLIIIATLFYVFIQIVKKKGFKGVIK